MYRVVNRRTLLGPDWKAHPDKFIDIGRPGIFGNPFTIGVHGTREEVVAAHAAWLAGEIPGPRGESPKMVHDHLDMLRNKHLVCWCAPLACHGDNLLALLKDTKETP